MSQTITWQDDLDTGIDVIDQQHRRIVAMINQLANGAPEAAGEVIADLLDYTQSHFAFEEELMAVAGYPLTDAHRRIHDMFARRVLRYQERHRAGEDVVDELRDLLSTWLFNHIRNDDGHTRNRYTGTWSASPVARRAPAGWPPRSPACSARARLIPIKAAARGAP